MVFDSIKKLLPLLACPDCHGTLSEKDKVLSCDSCNREYEIDAGVPILFPSQFDQEHLAEEQSLSDVMQRDRSSDHEQFIAQQWAKSKADFWRLVMQSLPKPPCSIVNIGCGFDTNFQAFQKRGDLFVNFDLVHNILTTLIEDHEAEYCVAGDINALPFKSAAFDCLTSIDVIHHESDNLEKILGRFADLLRPGGLMFLEDPNAWGMFQFHKSVLLPKPLYRFLRSEYHKLKGSTHKPADYEFPTNVWKVKKILEGLGFENVQAHPNSSYPTIGRKKFRAFEALAQFGRIQTYHNYHYTLSAMKKSC